MRPGGSLCRSAVATRMLAGGRVLPRIVLTMVMYAQPAQTARVTWSAAVRRGSTRLALGEGRMLGSAALFRWPRARATGGNAVREVLAGHIRSARGTGLPFPAVTAWVPHTVRLRVRSEVAFHVGPHLCRAGVPLLWQRRNGLLDQLFDAGVQVGHER